MDCIQLLNRKLAKVKHEIAQPLYAIATGGDVSPLAALARPVACKTAIGWENQNAGSEEIGKAGGGRRFKGRPADGRVADVEGEGNGGGSHASGWRFEPATRRSS